MFRHSASVTLPSFRGIRCVHVWVLLSRKGFKAFVIMAGDISFDIDKKTKAFQEYRQKIGADKFDAFAAQYAWMDGAKYVSPAAPVAMFLQYATDEPLLNGELAKQYFEIVSEPK